MKESIKRGDYGVSSEIFREEVEEANKKFSAVVFHVENAVFAFFTEGKEPRLGTLAVALPLRREGVAPALSSILLGDRNQTITRILAERFVAVFNKIGLVSTFTETVEENVAGRIFMRLIEKISGKEKLK